MVCQTHIYRSLYGYRAVITWVYIGFVNRGFQILWCKYLWVATSPSGPLVVCQPNIHICLNLVLFDTFFSLLIIHVWHPHNDIQMGVELSSLSNKMAAIAIWTFIKNNISHKVIDIETSFWCQTICFKYQGIIWNCLFTLLRY